VPHLLLVVLAAAAAAAVAAAPSPCVHNHWLQLEPLLNLQAAPVAGYDDGQSAAELLGALLAVTSGVQGPHTNHVTPAVANLTEVHGHLGQQGEWECGRSSSHSHVGRVARTKGGGLHLRCSQFVKIPPSRKIPLIITAVTCMSRRKLMFLFLL